EAVVAVARERLRDDASDALRHTGVVHAYVVGVLHANRNDHLLVRRSRVRRPPAQALVQDCTRGPDVRATLDVVERLRLLWRHVEWRSEHSPLPRERMRWNIPDTLDLRDSEIEDLREIRVVVAVDEENVVRLEIAMDDACFVRTVKAAEDLAD